MEEMEIVQLLAKASLQRKQALKTRGRIQAAQDQFHDIAHARLESLGRKAMSSEANEVAYLQLARQKSLT